MNNILGLLAAGLVVIGCGGSGGTEPILSPPDPTVTVAQSPSFEALNVSSKIVLSAKNAAQCSVTRTPASVRGRFDQNTLSIPMEFKVFGCDSIVTNPGSSMPEDYTPAIQPVSTYVITATNSVLKTASVTVSIPLRAGVGIDCSDLSIDPISLKIPSRDFSFTTTLSSKSGALTSPNASGTYRGTDFFQLKSSDSLSWSGPFLSPRKMTFPSVVTVTTPRDDRIGVRIAGAGGTVCYFMQHLSP